MSYVTRAHLRDRFPCWVRRRVLSALFGELGRCAHCMRSASPQRAADWQRLEACEELRSQEIPGAWADDGQRCHVGPSPGVRASSTI
jgi:hypothetical protein